MMDQLSLCMPAYTVIQNSAYEIAQHSNLYPKKKYLNRNKKIKSTFWVTALERHGALAWPITFTAQSHAGSCDSLGYSHSPNIPMPQ
uniref:Uncharacterized protein n=1 Tax=Anguilla anguilla TaxID=7936 RepID=A0A0E9WWF0_ANGAN